MRTRVALLMVALGALVPSMSTTAHAQSTVPGGLGYDVSWPQCGQPLPGGAVAVAVVGVTGGRPFTASPCLHSEAAWARGSSLPYDLYMNLNWPDSATAGEAANGPRGVCAAADVTCLGYNYGSNAVTSAVRVAVAAGAASGTWWLDVETGDHWSSDTAGNAAVVQGAIDALHGRRITAGVYSISFMWQQITGGYQAPGVPAWIPGPESIDFAHYYCNQRFSFDGGPVWMVQYPRSGLDGDLICTTESSWPATAAWHGVRYLGSGPLGGPPAAVAPSQGIVDVFWRGTDGGLWHTWEVNGSWFGPQSLGGHLASDPSVVSPSVGVIDVFWKADDGTLWHKWFNGRGWQGPASLGGELGTSPQAVAPGDAVVDVFWRGRDGSLTHAWYNHGWNAPHVLAAGSSTEGQLFPVSSNAGVVDVFWRGADNNLWHVFYNQGWNPPSSLGSGPLASDPHAVGWLTGHIEVTWTGTDGGLWEGVYAPTTGWLGSRQLVPLGLGTDPAPISWGLGDTDVYWRGTDGSLWHYWYGRSESIGDGPLGSRPSAVTGNEGGVTVVWKGSDNNLWVDWYG